MKIINRRTAILSLLAIAIVAFAGSFFFKFRRLLKKPDLGYLAGKQRLIGEVAETIIPATDTPGAKAAKVQDFIIKMVAECTEKRSQNNFIEGLKELEQYTLKTFGRDYLACSTEQRMAVLIHLEDKENRNPIVHKIHHRLMGDTFIYLMKYYTVLGYCTSEAGATKALAYDYIPGTFEACISLTSHQKCWATE